jgi:signal transduction histidine kinase
MYVGLSKGYAYQATFGSPVRYILGRMVWPMAAGLLLLGFTVMAFVVMYRNLQQQRRLAQYKNDFISNMTHELKTPISTIKVAVEALRHFDALDDPKRTREYLDISALELHRLSMLVDKVLKLSLLEKKVVEFHLTVFDLRELAAEVIAEMRLPFEKAGAVVQLTADGVLNVRGDRAHLSSVISNLLDNALKYSKEAPVITVGVWREDGMVLLTVTDNGIGVPVAYQGRIFDKFFRVPSGDHHNIKGYGLGLNYVQDIVQIHKGIIAVESKEGKGSTFTIKLPGHEQN